MREEEGGEEEEGDAQVGKGQEGGLTQTDGKERPGEPSTCTRLLLLLERFRGATA